MNSIWPLPREVVDLIAHHQRRAEAFQAEAERLARLLVPPPELATCAAQLPLPLERPRMPQDRASLSPGPQEPGESSPQSWATWRPSGGAL